VVSLNQSFDARILSEEAICERACVCDCFFSKREDLCVSMHIKLKSR
jgi:hypothetical protein